MDRMAERAKITLKGLVQGVGFRPYVYNLADSLDMKGYVTNTSDGVDIDVEGERLSDFMERLPREAPELSRIVESSVSRLPLHGYRDFRIIESKDEGRFTLISHDVSVCDDCLMELFDHNNRRYLYPFINCTNCGPRYSITRSVPYDRPNTTMSVFQMCDECLKEYHEPKDRRFHAQPNACAQCGPQTTIVTNHESRVTGQNPIERAIGLLKDGKIVAVKGLGGFHIACDAANEDTVRLLRERKRKSNKPFALMAPDIEFIKRYCEVSDQEKKLLLSNKRPVALLKKHKEFNLPDAVSPNNRYAGFMLPYTPLHYLLFYHPVNSDQQIPPHPPFIKRGRRGLEHFSALIMTSGNISEEPIVKDNDEAIKKLSGLVDAFLIHDRDIFMRVDDSVIKVRSEKLEIGSEFRSSHFSVPTSQFIRRSRGYVPEPIDLHDDGPDVLGCGADLKNTFTVTKGRFAIPGQHIGDMENYETLQFFEESLENIKAVYRVNPIAIAHDLHPDYLSTRWALRQRVKGSRDQGVNTFAIQHHYAHVGSVMAENGFKSKVIGVAFDGTGYGTDGNLWGGEFLVADINGFERIGHFRYMPLPGGESAIREPWKTAVSYVVSSLEDKGKALECLDAIGFIGKYGIDNIERIIKIIDTREFSPLSSGAGRLFDAVSAIIGLCDRNTFEGEAAMALESLTEDGVCDDYSADLHMTDNNIVIDFSPSIISIIKDLTDNRDRREIAAKFHNTVCNVILKTVKGIADNYGISDVALSGGTFQNLYLLERTRTGLMSEGMNVFINEKVPCNDGGISLGQAYIVRERLNG